MTPESCYFAHALPPIASNEQDLFIQLYMLKIASCYPIKKPSSQPMLGTFQVVLQVATLLHG